MIECPRCTVSVDTIYGCCGYCENCHKAMLLLAAQIAKDYLGYSSGFPMHLLPLIVRNVVRDNHKHVPVNIKGTRDYVSTRKVCEHTFSIRQGITLRSECPYCKGANMRDLFPSELRQLQADVNLDDSPSEVNNP